MGFLTDVPVTLIIAVLWIGLISLVIYFEDEEKYKLRVEFYIMLLGWGVVLFIFSIIAWYNPFRYI